MMKAYLVADDILLLAETRPKAIELLSLTELETYLHERDMSVSPAKCIAFEIKKKREAWHVADPEISTKDGTRINFMANQWEINIFRSQSVAMGGGIR